MAGARKRPRIHPYQTPHPNKKSLCRANKKASKTILKAFSVSQEWRPQGESNPRSRRERPITVNNIIDLYSTLSLLKPNHSATFRFGNCKKAFIVFLLFLFHIFRASF